MIVLISRRKIIASTRRCVATLGRSWPISAPSSMATKIHAVSERRNDAYATSVSSTSQRMIRQQRGRARRHPDQHRRRRRDRRDHQKHLFALTACVSAVMEVSAKDVFQLHSAIGTLVAILHDHRRVQRQAPLTGLALGDRARSRHDDRPVGTRSGSVSLER